jgi:hypothetical protein
MVPLAILIITVAIYLPLAGSLLYVWWKYGSEEVKVSLARLIFLLGSFALFGLIVIV